ncbi:hypothetical protein ACLB2K_032852 [Fragaria x ananassa]
MKKSIFSRDPFSLLLVAGLFASLSPLLLAIPGDHPNYGAYRPIEDIHNPHVIEIAEFAVSELNKQFQKKLVFQSVVRGEKQVVAGENYKLVITVKDESSSVNYECVVWEKQIDNLEGTVSWRCFCRTLIANALHIRSFKASSPTLLSKANDFMNIGLIQCLDYLPIYRFWDSLLPSSYSRVGKHLREEHGHSEKVTLFAILKEFDDIENFNSQEKHSFTLGLNAFIDLTYERVP